MQTGDRLDQIVQKQIELNSRFGIAFPDFNMSVLYQMSNFLKQEAAEVNIEIESVWKYWKKNPKEIDRSKVVEEVIDVLHYAINMCLATGLSSNDIYDEFFKKNIINNERQDKGY